jgi:primary-amine oxidase
VVVRALNERYGIIDMDRIAADPWSVHLSDGNADDLSLVNDDVNGRPRRLVQTFLYARMAGDGMEDNQYAHPIDIVPVIDLISGDVVRIDNIDNVPPPVIPETSVNYHRGLLGTNGYLQTSWRADRLRDLNVVQPDGPSFDVTDNNLVSWQGWTFRVGFNYREGLVLHDVKYHGRSIMNRASLVEMAVPYGDPHPPYTRKCAFDVGDYGLGYCANSLELGCDCLGHIHYFDVCMSDSSGAPYLKRKAICMHEEDRGLLWKHVEYRDGHSESRRSRELVLSSIATVVNYEYLFYWRFKLDGTIEYEIGLTGELSTNLVSRDEDPNMPSHGVLVAPGVNAQVHQHMFCARMDMAVDGPMNTVTEVDVLPEASIHGNAFGPHETVLRTEKGAVRTCDPSRARSWKISNATGMTNPITGKPTSYKLLPFTKGPSMPTLLTADDSSVSRKGRFGCANLWVTPFDENERYPAGEHTPQNMVPDGLPRWIEGDRNVEAENIVVWHGEIFFSMCLCAGRWMRLGVYLVFP